jgi:DNA replication and repair protein RecF
MRLERLRLSELRCIADADLELAPGLNVFEGRNGAGKTSVLEAAHLLSFGRTFRSGSRRQLVRRGGRALVVTAQVRRDRDGVDQLGLKLPAESQTWEAHLNGRPVARLSELLQRCAVCCFEPGSHELIGGSAERRREFVDWSLFHVEPTFLATWQRYHRALRQRNASLRGHRASQAELSAWDEELIRHGSALNQWRRSFVHGELEPRLLEHLGRLVPELGAVQLDFESGWSGAGTAEGLALALAERRQRDRERGQTGAGPHRADWRLRFAQAPAREHLSRGQEKLVALACILAQVDVVRQRTGEWPILCFDDLPSELDRDHQRLVLAQVTATPAQVLITGTHFEPEARQRFGEHSLFHVEHGLFHRA